MASPGSAAARTRSNAAVAKIIGSIATGVVDKSLPTVAKTVLKGATGPIAGVFLDASEANAMD